MTSRAARRHFRAVHRAAHDLDAPALRRLMSPELAARWIAEGEAHLGAGVRRLLRVALVEYADVTITSGRPGCVVDFRAIVWDARVPLSQPPDFPAAARIVGDLLLGSAGIRVPLWSVRERWAYEQAGSEWQVAEIGGSRRSWG